MAWHTAGLIDPMAIVQSSKKRYIMVGRHDLMTRPILGRWARAIGSQPVLRQREIDEGTTDAEFAKHINERSLLTVAHTSAGGNGCVIMPEGTSQVEPRMMPLRSGPMRIALNAAAAAQSSAINYHQSGLLVYIFVLLGNLEQIVMLNMEMKFKFQI